MVPFRPLFVLIALAAPLGCTSPPPAAPRNDQSSILAISVKVRAPVRVFSYRVQRVYFVRVDDGDPFSQDVLIPSNYIKDRYAYLLNAKPGRYAAVAVGYVRRTPTMPSQPNPGDSVTVTVNPSQRSEYTIYFNENLIKKTVVLVEPTTVEFMGDFVVDSSLSMKDSDSAQAHYYNVLEPGSGTWHSITKFMGGEYSSRGSEHASEQSEIGRQRFLESARKRLGKAGWSRLF